jgi:general secretion pathway protein I
VSTGSPERLKLSRVVNRSTNDAIAGFTIIEALVALAVVTVTIFAIGLVVASTARGTRQFENHVALVQAANNIFWLNLPGRLDPVSPVLTGESMGHKWRVDTEPVVVELEAPPGDVSWVPEKIRMQVQSPSGSVVSFETVRLFRRQTQ